MNISDILCGKRISSAAVLLATLLSFSACGTQTSANTEHMQTQTPQVQTEPTQATLPITEIQTEPVTEPPETQIHSLGLVSTDGAVLDDIGYFMTDGEISLTVPFYFEESMLDGATIYTDGDNISVVSFTDTMGETVDNLELYKEYMIEISDGECEKTYPLTVKRAGKDLPVISLYTDTGDDIVSKFDYVHGYISVDGGNSAQYGEYRQYRIPLSVRGRGNASWWQSDKKSYRIKLDEKSSILGLDSNKDWVLVPNYYDKTLIRNAVASKMAQQMEYLYYTPTHIMVDLFLNGEYRGVYSVADKIEEANGKIELGQTTGVDDIGFLIEIGWDFEEKHQYGRDYFDTDLLYRLFVKEPVIEKRYNEEMTYIMDYINKTEDAIVSGGDWEKYIDLDAFVDWFIIAELTNNTEMAFYRSCYMYKPQDGKLIMGPVWDFDMAFGNHKGDVKNYDAWATGEATYHEIGTNWTSYLVKDEKFMSAVKTRWTEKRDVLLSSAFSAIDEYSTQVYKSQIENFKLWDIMNKQVGIGRVDYKKYNTYELQVQYLKEFLTNRADWIDKELKIN